MNTSLCLRQHGPLSRSSQAVANFNPDTAPSQHTLFSRPSYEYLSRPTPTSVRYVVPQYRSTDPREQYVLQPQVQNTAQTRVVSPTHAFVLEDDRTSHDRPYHELQARNYNSPDFRTPTRIVSPADYNDTVPSWLVTRRRRTHGPSARANKEGENTIGSQPNYSTLPDHTHEPRNQDDNPLRPHSRGTPPHHLSPTPDCGTPHTDVRTSYHSEPRSEQREAITSQDIEQMLEGFDRALSAIVELCELQREGLRVLLRIGDGGERLCDDYKQAAL
jgi:hypothetical protein